MSRKRHLPRFSHFCTAHGRANTETRPRERDYLGGVGDACWTIVKYRACIIASVWLLSCGCCAQTGTEWKRSDDGRLQTNYISDSVDGRTDGWTDCCSEATVCVHRGLGLAAVLLRQIEHARCTAGLNVNLLLHQPASRCQGNKTDKQTVGR